MPKELDVARPPLATDRLPAELAEFLSRDTFSMVIKGESGSGKTLLALTILRALQPIENVLYISTRTSPLQLREHYPWIEEIFGPPGPIKGAGDGWLTLVDSRLDEPSTAFERVTNVLMDAQAPTVVLDSWEALGDELGHDALRANIKVVETWRERAGARFIFIGETLANTSIDYMVEGVVLLKERTDSGRRVREVFLSKLHGVRIRRPSRFFSLEGGGFRCFPEYSADDYAFRDPLPVRLDRPLRAEKGMVPSGHQALDTALKGGFPRGSLALLELDEDVDPRVGLVLVDKMVQDWSAKGGKVLLQSPRGVDPAYVKQYAKSFISKGKLVLSEKIPGRGPGGRLLAIVSADHYREDEKQWQKEVAALSERAGLTVVIAKGGTGEPKVLGAATKLRVSLVEGTLFLRGDVPWSPYMGVVPTSSAGNPIAQLEPVV